MIYITGILIILLVFTNAITDAPNAISTVVATRVLSFRKAAYLSAIFNFIGIISMCFINFSVAQNIASLIKFENTVEGVGSIFASIISTVIFALIALKFGVPTSETHSLVAGLAGASIAFNNFSGINGKEWIKVLIGLFWSIICTYIICKIISKLLKDYLNKISKKKIELFQILSCVILSFMHGAQDGLKFIGIFIIYYSWLKKEFNINNLESNHYIWIIILIASIMGIGVGIGGRTIVENIGSNIKRLSNSDAIITDITTGVTLLIASIVGIPVSTSHCKTVSIISVGEKSNYNIVKKILVSWLITFPVCFFISYIIIKISSII